MAKKFILKIFIITLIYLLLAGVITASDNSSRSLFGSQSDEITINDIEEYINAKILGRK